MNEAAKYVENTLAWMFLIIIITFPLAIWKVIDIIIWILSHHITISIS
jgi:hypothetical protein